MQAHMLHLTRPLHVTFSSLPASRAPPGATQLQLEQEHTHDDRFDGSANGKIIEHYH